MFRGKESSNRIELSRLVQELLNFGELGSLQLWGFERWVYGVGVVGGGEWGDGLGGWGYPHTCAHACMHMHAHTCVVNIIISCKWLLPGCNGFPQGIPIMTSSLMCTCACVCACTCAHMHGTLSHTP